MAYEHIQREIRKERKSQEEMAAILGRTPAVVTNLFNGVRLLKAREVPILAKWLGKNQGFILGTEHLGFSDEDREILEKVQYLKEPEKAVFITMLDTMAERAKQAEELEKNENKNKKK